MALEFSNTGELAKTTFLKVLCYGPAGVGKTVMFATLPGKKLLISAERGELSIAPRNLKKLFGKEESIDVVRISNAADLREAFELISGPHGAAFESIGLDSLSDIAETVLGDMLSKAKDGRKAYGELNELMAKYVRKFRDLPGKHIYMTAKQDREADGDGAVVFGPSMPGKTLTQSVAHYFDEVFALYVTPKDANGQQFRCLRTRADHQFSAKDRSGCLDEIEEPNLAKIIAKIRNS
jgi:phage nucleotide-binding protein